MTKKKTSINNRYGKLLNNIGQILEVGRRQAAYAVNQILVNTYWQIGKELVVYEQAGQEKAAYGDKLLLKIAKELSYKYGKGFSRSNLQSMRALYLKYPICQTLSGKLGWSHYVELLNIEQPLAQSFYEKQCLREGWSVRELKRQINSMLFERLALSKNKAGIRKLAKKGQSIEKQADILREPYVLEFLNIPQHYKYSEKELETKLIDNLRSFLLELGEGFSFVGRQYRITLNNTHYYVDLVFYHRRLKCFVLIDLKTGNADHLDVGQMNMYLNYFREEENVETDNPPVGMILAANKNDIMIKYALGGLSNKVFVARYKLHLPDKELLQARLKALLS